MAKGYQSYRGRASKGRVALITLLVLIVVAACGYLFIQRYVVYTDDGGWHFDLPFAPDSGEEDEPPYAGDDVNLVVDADGSRDDDDGGEEPPEEEPYGPRKLVPLAELPTGGELGAAVEAALAEAGANGFVYTVRDNTGRVFYNSSVSQAQAAQRHISMEALAFLCAEMDTTAVARFNCFHDSYYAFVYPQEAGVCAFDGTIWTDEISYYWLDPAKEAARQYVIDLAVECAQMGFDELLLEELAYPAGGRQEYIDYTGNTMGKSEALTLFVTELREAVADYQVKLSLLVSEELLQAGADETSGQDLWKLVPLVDAVYVPTSDAETAETLLAQYAGTGPVPELVPIVEEPGEGNWCLSGS